MKNLPKIQSRQCVHLIQVTGSASISVFITTPLIFETPEGPVELLVETYVVKEYLHLLLWEMTSLASTASH
jgi:hypothetical protein